MDAVEQVHLRDLPTGDPVDKDPVVLRQRRDVGEQLVVAPLLAVSSTGLDARSDFAEPARSALETVRQDVTVVVLHLIEKGVEVRDGVRGALYFHRASD